MCPIKLMPHLLDCDQIWQTWHGVKTINNNSYAVSVPTAASELEASTQIAVIITVKNTLYEALGFAWWTCPFSVPLQRANHPLRDGWGSVGGKSVSQRSVRGVICISSRNERNTQARTFPCAPPALMLMFLSARHQTFTPLAVTFLSSIGSGGRTAAISPALREYAKGNASVAGDPLILRRCWQVWRSVPLWPRISLTSRATVFAACRSIALFTSHWLSSSRRDLSRGCYDISRFPPVLGTINYTRMAIKTSLQNEPAPWHFHLPDLCQALKKREAEWESERERERKGKMFVSHIKSLHTHAGALTKQVMRAL